MSHFPKLIIRRCLWEANQVDHAVVDQAEALKVEALEEDKETEEVGQAQPASLRVADEVINNI